MGSVCCVVRSDGLRMLVDFGVAKVEDRGGRGLRKGSWEGVDLIYTVL